MENKQFHELVGEVIKARRLQKGMSKKGLGLELGYAPNSAGQVISKIESGKIAIPQKKIAAIIKALDITHEKLGISDLTIPIETVLTSPSATKKILTEPVPGSIAAGAAIGVVGGPIGLVAGAIVGGLLGGLSNLFDLTEDIVDAPVDKSKTAEGNNNDVIEKISELCKGDEKKMKDILEILNS